MIRQEFPGDGPRTEIRVCLKCVCWFTYIETGTVHAYSELAHG